MNIKKNWQGRYPFICALLLGVIHTQSFAPLNLWWLQLCTLAGLFYLIHQSANKKQAVCFGWLFGLGWFTSGIWWLYISMHIYGEMPAALAIVSVVLLSAALALFPALASWCVNALCHITHNFRQTIFWLQSLASACCWGVSEWLRGTLLTGFPWVASGYAHADGPLSGYAAFVGVYGVSAIAAWVAILLSYFFLISRNINNKNRSFCVYLFGTLLLTLIAGWALQKIRFTQMLPHTISVRLIQGNIPQDMKFDPVKFYLAMQRYAALMTQARADLIVAPETTFPVRAEDLPLNLMAHLHGFARQSQSEVLFGTIGVNAHGQPQNSLFTLNGYQYHKSHLVPFGEFIPPGFAWFMHWLNMPLGDFSRGVESQLPLIIKGTALAPNICYEDLFGEEIARSLRRYPANILVNASNIAWFGNTRALDQHLQIARFRSLETQLPTLRATNTGMTAWIDEHGQVRAHLPRLMVGSLAVKIRGAQGMTPFVRWGNVPFLLLSMLLISCMVYLKFRRGNTTILPVN